MVSGRKKGRLMNNVAKHVEKTERQHRQTIAEAWDKYLNTMGDIGQTKAFLSYLQKERLAMSKADPRRYQKPKPRPDERAREQ